MSYLQAFTSLFGAVGSMQAGSDADRVAEHNAGLDEREAELAASQGFRNEEQLRREAAMTRGRLRAAIAQSGGGESGSNRAVLEQSDAAAELDALNVRYAGLMKRSALLSRAMLTRMGGKQQKRQSELLAGAQVLRGVSDSYTNYGMSF